MTTNEKTSPKSNKNCKKSPPEQEDPNIDSIISRKNIEAKPFEIGENPELSLYMTITCYGKRKSGKSFFLRWWFDY